MYYPIHPKSTEHVLAGETRTASLGGTCSEFRDHVQTSMVPENEEKLKINEKKEKDVDLGYGSGRRGRCPGIRDGP